MKRFQVNLLREIKGDLYRHLLDYAVAECSVALLVVRPTISIELSGRKLLNNLDKFLVSKSECSQWPGTVLLYGATAQVFQYKFNLESALLFKQAVSGLYEWVQPTLPEDLCLLRNTNEPWLVSISHEQDSYFYISKNEEDSLVAALPELKLYIEV